MVVSVIDRDDWNSIHPSLAPPYEARAHLPMDNFELHHRLAEAREHLRRDMGRYGEIWGDMGHQYEQWHVDFLGLALEWAWREVEGDMREI